METQEQLEIDMAFHLEEMFKASYGEEAAEKLKILKQNLANGMKASGISYTLPNILAMLEGGKLFAIAEREKEGGGAVVMGVLMMIKQELQITI